MKKTKKILMEFLNLQEGELIPYAGEEIFKLNRKGTHFTENQKRKIILISSISPTPYGEGKTTTAIALTDALNQNGSSAILSIREPSQGPYFGLKGGAIGGGAAKVEPAFDINLHFTGDFSALNQCINLIAAYIDAHIFENSDLQISEIIFPRAIDINDRNLRVIETKLGQREFVLTAAHPLMTIITLAKNQDDLIEKINELIIAFTNDRKPVYIADLKITNYIQEILSNVLKPNLVLTSNKSPAFIHMGPFANVSVGTSSIKSLEEACELGDNIITEAGFGADLGLRKFKTLVEPNLRNNVKLVVIVITLKAILHQSSNLDESMSNIEKILYGLENVKRHLEIVKECEYEYVISLNKYAEDDDESLQVLTDYFAKVNVPFYITNCYDQGYKGALCLANYIKNLTEQPISIQKMLTDYSKLSILEKLKYEVITFYKGDDITLTKKAQLDLDKIYSLGYEFANVCIAKTQYSFTDNKEVLGVPKNFKITFSRFQLISSLNLVICYTKGIITLPGLPKNKIMKA